MNTFQITIKDKLAILQLNRGRSNPINAEMVTELTAFVKDIEADESVGGLIITGKENFFSSGLDLIELYNYIEGEISNFFKEFLELQRTLVSFKKPLVAAISGHSPAGGCVMAICCDYRVMAAGKFIIGLNEIPVGIIVPDSIFQLYAFWVGKHKAYQYLIEGKLLQVEDALKEGLIDEIVTAEELLEVAEKRIRVYMEFNPVTWSQSKLNLRKELIGYFNTDQTQTLRAMLKQWWAPETRQTLNMIIQSLTKKA